MTVGPKQGSHSSKVKRKVVRTMIELKKEIVAKYDGGVCVSGLAEYGMVKSMSSTVLKYKEAIKSADVTTGVKVLMNSNQK